MVKNLKILLVNQEANDLGTWYTASGTRVPPVFSYDHPGMTFTIFMTGPSAPAWVKALSANVFPSSF